MTRRAEHQARIDVETWRRLPLARRVRRLLGDAARVLDAEEATLWSFADDDAWLTAALNHGPAVAVVEGQRVPVAASVVGLAAIHGLTFAIGPGEWQNPAVIDATGTAVRAMIAVPVRQLSEIVGVLSIINPHGRNRFDVSALDEAGWNATLTEGLLAAEMQRLREIS